MCSSDLEKGATETYEPILVPYQGGMLAGQITVEYEDVTGTVQTLIHDFEMEVMESYVPDMGGDWYEPSIDDIPAEEGNKLPWPMIAGVGIGVLGAAGITALVLKKRRSPEEAFEDDED